MWDMLVVNKREMTVVKGPRKGREARVRPTTWESYSNTIRVRCWCTWYPYKEGFWDTNCIARVMPYVEDLASEKRRVYSTVLYGVLKWRSWRSGDERKGSASLHSFREAPRCPRSLKLSILATHCKVCGSKIFSCNQLCELRQKDVITQKNNIK